MFQETNDIGRYTRVPYHVATAKISSRARAVWTLLAMNCTPKSPEVWVRQATLAEQLHCSTDTIHRAIHELFKSKLLLPTKKWHQGRYKIYHLVWENGLQICGTTFRMDAVQPTAELRNDPPQNCDTTCRTDAELPVANLRVDVPQKCGPLNRVLIKHEQNIYLKKTREDSSNPESETQKLLADWGDLWCKRFACLDGLSGRPSIETCVEQAMNHSARLKCADAKIYIEMWLQNAARQWLLNFNREQNAPPTDPSLDAEAKARRSRKYYTPRVMLPVVDRNMLPAELQAQVEQIFDENQPGWSEKLIKLMKIQKREAMAA